MSSVGVQYIMEGKEDNWKDAILPEKRFPPNLFDLAWQNDAWRIWQYKDALPRTFIAHDIIIENDPQKNCGPALPSNVNLHNTVNFSRKPLRFRQLVWMHQEKRALDISAYEANKVTITVYAEISWRVIIPI